MSSTLRIAVISSPNFQKGEPKIVTELLENGLDKFHLRKPDHSVARMAEFLDAIPRRMLKKIIIHRTPELLKDYPVGGYHHTARESLKPFRRSRSRSLHKLKELANVEPELSYVFFGPVYHSISKVGHKPKVPLADIRKSLAKLSKNPNRPMVYALGGIRRNKIGYLMDTGFDGVALLGSIWGKPNPVHAFKEFARTFDSHASRLKGGF